MIWIQKSISGTSCSRIGGSRTNNQVSCSTCHDLTKGGTDRLRSRLASMAQWALLTLPPVFNSGFNFSQFGMPGGHARNAGRRALLSKAEMGSTWPEVIEKLQSSPEYVQAFRQSMAVPFNRRGERFHRSVRALARHAQFAL